MLNELRRDRGNSNVSSKDEIHKVMRQLELIRKELWGEYEKRIS
jgi:hypothetical protein